MRRGLNLRPEEFMQSMRSLFADTDSETEKDKEIHFQNMMAIAAKMIGLTVRTEIHSAKGRCDKIFTQRQTHRHAPKARPYEGRKEVENFLPIG